MNAATALAAVTKALAEHREDLLSWGKQPGYVCSCSAWALPFGNGPVESARLHRVHRAEKILEALLAALSTEEDDMPNSL